MVWVGEDEQCVVFDDGGGVGCVGDRISFIVIVFFFNDTATTEIYTLSLHDALPIWS